MSAQFGLATRFETTLNTAIRCDGIGLHTGAPVSMRLRPASTGTGIVFVRTDVPQSDARVPAHFDAVTQTMLGTVVSNAHGVSVATVEHLMAALAGCGIDNLEIDIDGPEVPIMDGSAAPFVFLIECAGLSVSDRPRRYLRILETVTVEDGPRRAELSPGTGFAATFEIDFDTPIIGRQHYSFDLSSAAFKTELCRARTFGFLKDVDQLRAMGLAQGGSLENAIVIDDGRILNESGLRYGDEFVRHKLLDAIGDLALCGGQIHGRLAARRSGHDLNNRLLHELFKRPAAWTWQTQPDDPALAMAPSPAD